MQQAVDAAEIDEGAVVGDVLHHAVDDLTFLEALHQLRTLLGAGLFKDSTARHDDVAAALVHLEDLEGLRRVHERRHVAHRADIDLRTRQEGHGTVEVDGEAALDLVEDDAGHLLVVVEAHLELDPALFAAGLLAAEYRLAERIFDALEIDLDLVANLEVGLAAGCCEFLERDAALGLEADVDDGEILFDRDDSPLDDRPFHHLVGVEGLCEKGGEIFFRGGGSYRH